MIIKDKPGDEMHPKNYQDGEGFCLIKSSYLSFHLHQIRVLPSPYIPIGGW